MANMPTAEERLKPQDWITRIDAALKANTVKITPEITKQWATLKAKTVHDGAWHKEVQQKVVIPFNIFHGDWAAGRKTLGGKVFPTISAARLSGVAGWVSGEVISGGYPDFYANFDRMTVSSTRGIWLGTYVGRGEHVFSGDKVKTKLKLQHNNFEPGKATRVWYTTGDSRVIYAVTDHVDSSPAGVKTLGALERLVTGWIDNREPTVRAAFLDVAWAPQHLFLVV